MKIFKGRLKSFYFAFQGLWYVMRFHINFSVQLTAAVVILFVGWQVGISRTDWMILLIVIGLVLTLELVNTSIETTLDYLAHEHHVDVKNAKDVSAAAVLIMSIVALVVGLLMFSPYLY